MAFKLRSGNTCSFKNIGSSPLKQTELEEVTIVDERVKRKENPSKEDIQHVEIPEIIVEDKKIEKEPKKKIEKEPKKKTDKKDKKYDKLSVELKKQNEFNRRKEKREKREKYRKKTQAFINLLDKPGL